MQTSQYSNPVSGPGTYNPQTSFNTLSSKALPYKIRQNEKGGKTGGGNYIYVGQNIIFDTEMKRMFPSGVSLEPKNEKTSKENSF